MYTIINVKRLKELREEKGLSQAELAEAIGRSQSAISHIEKGDFPPKLQTLIDITNVLGVTVDELLMKGSDEACTNDHSEAE